MVRHFLWLEEWKERAAMTPQILPCRPEAPECFRTDQCPSATNQTQNKGRMGKNVQCNEFFINLNCFNLKDFPLIGEYTLWGGRKALKMCVLSDHESMLQFKKYLYLAKWNVEIFLFAQSLVGCFNWTAPWNLSLGKSTICDDLITCSLQSLWI